MAGVATHRQRAMFESAALEKFFKSPLYITRQFLALLCHKSCKCRVNLIDDLIEKRLLGPVTLVTSSILLLAGTWGIIRVLALLCLQRV